MVEPFDLKGWREGLNNLPATAPEVADESQHFYVCTQCGEAVDMRRLGDVFHHEDLVHERINRVS